MKSLLFIIVMTAMPCVSWAESKEPTTLIADPMSLAIYVILGLILLVLLYTIYMLKAFIDMQKPASEQKPMLAGIISKLTDTVPVEFEEAILTDHAYDGIRELDNNLPPWWKYMFYATIVYSFGYIYYYHFYDNGTLQIKEYEQEVAQAKIDIEEYMKHAANSIDETNVKFADSKGIEGGKALYLQNCAACHGQSGEGIVGPNLTDEYWLHGGDIKDVFKTIKYGVPQNGMISWKAQMSPLNIQNVASYIKSLKGTNPPNGKAPQGDKYEEKDKLSSK
jgi:cytochrome c oxidase cbb3-type subunit 3